MGIGFINPFMPNVFFHRYQLDESISNFRAVGWYFSFLFKIYKKLLFANSGESDQTPRFAASDLVLQCLPMSHKKDTMLIWVKLKLRRVYFTYHIVKIYIIYV